MTGRARFGGLPLVEVAMYQPYLSSGQPPRPPQPSQPPRPPRPPAPVLTAVKLMYAGAAVSTAGLIIGLALIIVDIQAAARGRFLGHSLAAPKPLVLAVWVLFGLVVIALWLWMARANGQGRNWARIVSTVLFGAATLDLTEVFGPPGIRLSLVPVIAGSPTVPVLYWLVGLAAVWLLWRPASRAFFRPPDYTQAQQQAQMAELARIRARVPC